MTTNRFWRLDANPEGSDFASALSLQEEEMAPLEEGQIRVKGEYLSMDAGTRMWMGPREDGYQPPQPIGTAMQGQSIGRVVESRDERHPEGQLIRIFGQWADYSTVRPDEAWAVPLDDSIDDVRQHFAALGLNGWTALYGMQDILAVGEDDVVVVSAAAGATGSIACQVARLLGAKVIGIAGGPEKSRYLIEDLGCEHAVDYKNEDVEAALRATGLEPTACFENVGGDILDATIRTMALHGRIGICGLIATYDRDEGMPGPASFDQVLMKRLRIEGLFLPDVPERGEDFYNQMKAWYEAGDLKVDIDETEGLENTLVAYERMMTGKNLGKVLVKL